MRLLARQVIDGFLHRGIRGTKGQTLDPGCFAAGFLGGPLTCSPAPGWQSSLSVGEGSEGFKDSQSQANLTTFDPS